MKAIILTGISAVAVTVAAVEASALTVSPEFNSLLYPHLAELNQSQTVETLSLADGVTRLPAFAYKLAGVHFLANANNKIGFNYNEQQFNQDNLNRCKKLGFSQTSCAADETPVRFCPYDERYFSQCCNNAYAYSRGECSYPRTISTNSCGGKYKCYCDTKLYPYTSCPNPKEPYDKCVDDSGTHYAECRCPSYYKPCSENNMQGVGTGCNDGSKTVYAACECKAAYKYVCEQFGPTSSNDYCLNGIRYYTSCKTCGEYGYLSSCPTGVECSFEQCSGKYFPTGKCASGYTDISDTSCEWYKYWMPCTVAPERN